MIAAPSRLRAWRRLAGIAVLLAAYLPLHALWQILQWRSPWPRRFLRAAGRAAGARVRIIGTPLDRDVLILANHVSWLDILILAGATGARFVAKSEVGEWPGIGWLAGQNRTVYVARAERGRVHEQAAALSAAVAEHQPVALFPEGGTGDGRGVGPFHASLLAAMTPPPHGTLIQPVLIDYGPEAPIVAWTGESSFGADAMRLLGLPGRRDVVIHCLDPIDPALLPDRKALAAAARDAIIAALGAGAAKRL